MGPPVVSWLWALAAAGALYERCGLLSRAEARLLLLVATPKDSRAGEWGGGAAAEAPRVAGPTSESAFFLLIFNNLYGNN